MGDISHLRSLIIGTWDLQSFTLTTPDGKTIHPMSQNPVGIHIFTFDQYMTASILNPGMSPYASPNPFAATTEEYAESARRFMGWAGKWSIAPLPPSSASVKQHESVTAAALAYEIHVVNFPNQLGKTQERKVWVEDDGKVLVITSLDDGHGPFLEYRWKRAS